MQDSKSNQRLNDRARLGFTLIEIMVSISIFLLSMGVAAQLFLYSMRAYRILLAQSQAIGEMSYNLEHISRGLRMAKKSLSADSPACLSAPGINFEKVIKNIRGKDTQVLVFKSPNVSSPGGFDCVEYYLGHPNKYPDGVTALMERRTNPGHDLPLTSPGINILVFSIADGSTFGGWDQADDLQPRVTVYIKTQDKEGKILEDQFTVSQRDLDVVQ